MGQTDGIDMLLEQSPAEARPRALRDLAARSADPSRGRSGYVALYRYDPAADTAVVLAIRHQRESR